MSLKEGCLHMALSTGLSGCSSPGSHTAAEAPLMAKIILPHGGHQRAWASPCTKETCVADHDVTCNCHKMLFTGLLQTSNVNRQFAKAAD